MTIYFDENKEAYAQIETLNKWGKTLLYQCSDNEYKEFKEGKRIWQGNVLVVNPNYETEQAQKEAERIAMLNLTGADVERAIYKAKGMDFDDIITFLEAQPLSEEGQPVVDIKALKIELKANNFYRGNPYIDVVGTILGFTKQQLDEFFETNDYTKLITQKITQISVQEI